MAEMSRQSRRPTATATAPAEEIDPNQGAGTGTDTHSDRKDRQPGGKSHTDQAVDEKTLTYFNRQSPAGKVNFYKVLKPEAAIALCESLPEDQRAKLPQPILDRYAGCVAEKDPNASEKIGKVFSLLSDKAKEDVFSKMNRDAAMGMYDSLSADQQAKLPQSIQDKYGRYLAEKAGLAAEPADKKQGGGQQQGGDPATATEKALKQLQERLEAARNPEAKARIQREIDKLQHPEQVESPEIEQLKDRLRAARNPEAKARLQGELDRLRHPERPEAPADEKQLQERIEQARNPEAAVRLQREQRRGMYARQDQAIDERTQQVIDNAKTNAAAFYEDHAGPDGKIVPGYNSQMARLKEEKKHTKLFSKERKAVDEQIEALEKSEKEFKKGMKAETGSETVEGIDPNKVHGMVSQQMRPGMEQEERKVLEEQAKYRAQKFGPRYGTVEPTRWQEADAQAAEEKKRADAEKLRDGVGMVTGVLSGRVDRVVQHGERLVKPGH